MTFREGYPGRPAGHDDPAVGLLLTAAGWAGGGVASVMVLQGLWPEAVSAAPDLDGFLAVVTGSLLVGPVVSAFLLWKWGQVRMVTTAAGLCAAGIVAAVPTLLVLAALVSSGATLAAILAFVAGWGVGLPVAVRHVVVRLDHPWLAADEDDTPSALATPDLWAELAAGDRFSDAADVGPRPLLAEVDRCAVARRPAAPPPGPPVDDALPPVRLPPR